LGKETLYISLFVHCEIGKSWFPPSVLEVWVTTQETQTHKRDHERASGECRAGARRGLHAARPCSDNVGHTAAAGDVFDCKKGSSSSLYPFKRQEKKAYEDFSHDAGFITDVLEGVFRTMNILPEWESTSLPRVVDRCVARLEYFRRRAQAPRNTTAAAELEDRILQRDLPEHIRGSRRYVDKHTPTPKAKK